MGGTLSGLAGSFHHNEGRTGKGLGEGGRVIFQGGEIQIPSLLPMP